MKKASYPSTGILSHTEYQNRSNGVTYVLNKTEKTKKLFAVTKWIFAETTHVVGMKCSFARRHSLGVYFEVSVLINIG